MRFGLHNVSINELLVRENLLGNDISNVNNAVFLSKMIKLHCYLLVGIIIKEDVLSVVVSLVDEKELGILIVESTFFPVAVIILNCHRGSLLKSLQNVLELRNNVSDKFGVFILFDAIESLKQLAHIISDSLVHTSAKFSILQLMRESEVARLLVCVLDFEIFGALRAIELY